MHFSYEITQSTKREVTHTDFEVIYQASHLPWTPTHSNSVGNKYSAQVWC